MGGKTLKVKKFYQMVTVLLVVFTLSFIYQTGFTQQAIAASSTKTTKTTSIESTSKNQAHKLTIPKLKTIVGVSVNTGSVSYTVSGETITFSLNSGSPSRTVQTGGSPADSKSISVAGAPITVYQGSVCRENNGNGPGSIYYNDGVYSGTLQISGVNSTFITTHQCPDGSSYEEWRLTPTYSGVVSKPDTRTYQYYYQYTVTVTYIDNTDPEVTLNLPINNTERGMAYSLEIEGSVKDIDIGDLLTVFYQVDNGPSRKIQQLTASGKFELFSGEIPLSTFTRGTHSLRIWAEDNNGGSSDRIQRTFVILSSNAKLSNFSINYQKMDQMRPTFNKDTTGYLLDVDHETSEIRVTPFTEEEWSTIKVNGNYHKSGTVTSAISLPVGISNINMEVTAEDGITKKNYQLRVTRRASNNISLTNLALTEGILSPVFDAKIFDYSSTVPYHVDKISLIPTVQDSQATIKVNNEEVRSGSPSKPIPLQVGTNSIVVRVLAADGTTSNSTQVTITRKGNSDANLSDLRPSVGGLSPTFRPEQYEYSVSVPNHISTIHFTPVSSDKNALVTVNGNLVLYGESSNLLTLTEGENLVSIVIKAEDGTMQEYKVTITREQSDNALLKTVEFTDVSLRSAFDKNTFSYQGTALPNVTTTSVLAIPEDPKAKVTLNGEDITGVPKQLAITSGQNTVKLTVSAASGIENVYTFVINRLGGSNALLADLWVSEGQLSPSFVSTKNEYEVSVTNRVDTIKVTAVGDDIKSTIKVNGEVYGSGETSNPLKLQDGQNRIVVEVIAENGVTSNTYIITVKRALSNNSKLKDLSISYGLLKPKFESKKYDYSVEIPYSVPSITVKATGEQGSIIFINGKKVQNNTSSPSIPLLIGSNEIKITVKSPDGSAETQYILNVNRLKDYGQKINGFMVSPIDTQLVAMFSNPNNDYVTGELWHNGVKEWTQTSRSNTIVFGSNGKRVSVKKGEVYTVKITFRKSGATAQETVTALGSPDIMAQPVSVLRLVQNTPLLATLVWKAPANKTPATEYEVAVFNENTGKRVQSIRVKSEEYEFKKISPGTTYRYEVRRLDVHRKPSIPMILSERSADLYYLSSPIDLIVQEGTDILTIKWNGEGDTYEIRAYVNGKEQANATTTKKTWAIKKQPGIYEFYVIAKKSGYRDSEPAKVTTYVER